MGKIWLYCGGRSFKNCLEANDQRILKQKIESQLYRSQWHMVTWSLEDRRGGDPTSSLLYKVSEILYWPQRVCTKCYMLFVSVSLSS